MGDGGWIVVGLEEHLVYDSPSSLLSSLSLVSLVAVATTLLCEY